MACRYLLASLLTFFTATCATAADWRPERPIKITVPYAAGGSADVIARVVAQRIRTELGQPVIVENKPGAGTIIGAMAVAKAPADGYSLLLATSTTMSIAPLVQKQIPYSPSQFVPVAGFMSVPFMVLVNKDLPVNTVQDLVALSRSKPGVLNYGTLGTGTSNHVLGALLSTAAGDSMVAVHYTSAGPALIGLERGDIHVYFDGIPTSVHKVASGQYKGIAVTSKTRIPGVSNVPTVFEQGFPQVGLSVWYGLVAPADTPANIISTLNAAVRAAISDPDVTAQITRDGTQPLLLDPQAFQRLIDQDASSWRTAFSTLQLKLD
ncbi:Bug family tripartite tricarboxylate transporter substrate binding protein [Bordetella muralis]|uniref:Bug family tripartite tricarboxylate transporter substrate binding protein n=1 Tax=Bordetella muralis TaxID=1649130 RepID=UPI0039F0CDF6